MGKGFDLDKKTVVAELFMNTDTYVVPPYQRDYSWDKDEVEDFWNDLINAFGDESYFIGSMVFQSPKTRREPFVVIDGQQRLATITILLAAIRDALSEINNDAAIKLNQNYILKELENGAEIRKLSLNLANREVFYYSIQLMPGSPDRKDFSAYSKLTKTNKLIKNAYGYFKNRLEVELRGKNQKDKIDYLNSLVEHTRETLQAITICVDTEEEAYLIFETINDRGLELSVADLFKNHLIREAKTESDKDEITDMWKEITTLLDDKVRAFLRHYWVSKKGQTTERQLFVKLKNLIENEKLNTKDLTKELKDEALNYDALSNPENYSWQDKVIIPLIQEFNILKVKQCLPLLMAGMKKLNENEFKKLLSDITNFTFRYSTICNKHNNVLEAKYSEAAIQIREGKISNVIEAMKVLKTIYPDENEFIEAFNGRSVEGKLARYILTKIEANNAKYQSEKPNYKTCSLEHILPQNPDEEWEKYLIEKIKKKELEKEEIEEITYLLGNLTLLDVDINRQAKNSFFTKKRDEYYKKSILWLNQSLKSITEWDKNAIKSRQNILAKTAEHIWSVRF